LGLELWRWWGMWVGAQFHVRIVCVCACVCVRLMPSEETSSV